MSPFGRLDHVPVDIDGVRTFADFEVIDIVDHSCPYPALLGIDWDFDNFTIVSQKKRRMHLKVMALGSLHLLILMKVADTQNL